MSNQDDELGTETAVQVLIAANVVSRKDPNPAVGPSREKSRVMSKFAWDNVLPSGSGKWILWFSFTLE